jgi:death-on-curing protein
MQDVTFIDKEHIFRLHKLAIDDFGGAIDVRDADLIDSALAQPMATFGGDFLHATIQEMAAAYYYHISQNQGFSDGNKRTGFLALFTFLKINGHDLTVPSDYVWPVLLRVANGELEKADLAEFLTHHTTKLSV